MAATVWNFSMCLDVSACDCTQGRRRENMNMASESTWKADSASKFPCHTRESNPCQYCTWLLGPTLYWHPVNTPVFTSLSFPTTSGVVFRYLSGSTVLVSHGVGEPGQQEDLGHDFLFLNFQAQAYAANCPWPEDVRVWVQIPERSVFIHSLSTMEIIWILTERTTLASIIILMLMVTVVKLTETAAKIKEWKTFSSVCMGVYLIHSFSNDWLIQLFR